MTGTAHTEAGEFAHTYALEVVTIPTNRAMIRAGRARPDLQDRGGEVQRGRRRHRRSATTTGSRSSSARSRSRSRSCSRACSSKRGIHHAVLNAKQHEREAHVVTQAGRPYGVTVATNMAGRGVDILLGGNPEGLAESEMLAEGLTDPDEAPERYAELRRRLQGRVRRGGRPRARARRSLRARHRAPREPPDRRPAPRPVRPPGRPGREPLLPVARGRPDAAVRDRCDELGHGQGLPRRPAARGEDGHEGDRAGPAHRRGPQLRDPQGRPQVRRGDERAAQGDLQAPPADPRRRGPPRRGHRRRSRVPSIGCVDTFAARRVRRGVGRRRADHAGEPRGIFPTELTARSRSTTLSSAIDLRSSCSSTTRSRSTRRRRTRSARRRSARSSVGSCSR